ncbi:MAG: ABC transporter permease [Deltaproteobacteria bacterium]|nr:ABC transporter permease [Deltaproteobacteria bacterium]
MKQDFLIFLDFTKKLWKNRYMLKMMTERELKATYVGSLFGFAWAVINPIGLVAIYGTVFGHFFKSKPDPAYGTESYLLFLMCGMVPWQFFAQTINGSIGSVAKNATLVKKAVGFPSEILPVVTVLSHVISHLIGVTILFFLTIAFDGGVSPWALVIFVYIFFMVIFSVGIGWILSSLSVYLRDLNQVIGLALMAWFFFTPIFYPAARLSPGALRILRWNPVFHVVDGYRLTMLAGKPPDLAGLAYLGAAAVVTFAAGGILFRRLKPGFAEVL